MRPPEGRWLAIPRSRWSLRMRVIAATLFVAFAPLLVVFAWSQLDRPTMGRLWDNVRDAADDVKDPTDAVALARIAERRGVWLRVVRDDGKIVADVDADGQHEPLEDLERFFLGVPPPQPLSEVDPARGPILARDGVDDALRGDANVDCNFDYTVLFCEARKLAAPHVLVIATQSSSRGVTEVYGLRRRLLRLALVTSPLAILVAWLTARRVVRPLEALKRQALARMRERSEQRPDETRDEVHDLARTLDDLLSELERGKVEHERFVADLVHELKSPVAAVRAAAEALGEASADPRTERLTRAIEASGRRLESVVTRFLDLARAEAGFPNEARELVDLTGLVTECVAEDTRAIAVDVAPGLVVRGIEPRLSAMVRELLDNALSFGDEVTLTVRRDAGEIVVRVQDDGPGIAPADLERIFDRYYTTRGNARGTGLGLPLVRAVAEAHGGRAWAESEPAGGAVVTVTIPAPA